MKAHGKCTDCRKGKAIVNLKAKGRTIRACDKCDQVEA